MTNPDIPIIETNHNAFALNDRAANYGDGVFTTMRVREGKIALRDYHIRRLVHDCSVLGMAVTQADITRWLNAALEHRAEGVLKLHVSAGEGGRGYQRPEQVIPIARCSWYDYPSHYTQLKQYGANVGVSQIQLGKLPLLARLKHINRLEQVMVKSQITKPLDDVIVCDEDQCVVEASAGNIFWFRDGIWFTPCLTLSGVAGVMRAFLIERMKSQAIPLQIGRFHISQCVNASAMMITNALLETLAVRQIATSGDVVTLQTRTVDALWNGVAEAYANSYA